MVWSIRLPDLDNDATVEILAKMAVLAAGSGADISAFRYDGRSR